MLIALALAAAVLLAAPVVVDDGSSSTTVPVAPSGLIEHGSVNAIDHRAGAAVPQSLLDSSISAIDHRSSQGG